MIVKHQKPIEFNNTCNAIFDENDLRSAILWYINGLPPITRLKTIFLHGRYPGISIHGDKIHIHRLIMSWQIGGVLFSSDHVHHKDDNKLNALKENLEVKTHYAHMSGHNAGKVLSREHKTKISESNKRRKGIKLPRRVDVDMVELKRLVDSGCSINAIAKHFCCDWSTIKQRIFENPELGKEEGNG